MNNPFIKQYGITLEDGKYIRIHPVKIGDLEMAALMLNQFNTDYGIKNFINFDGTANSETYESMMEFVKYATKQYEEDILEWLNVENLRVLTNYFKEISQYKTDANNKGNPIEWDILFASMLENTSLNMDDILSLTVSQLEYILEGFTKKNQRVEDNDSNVLTGTAAIEALKKMGNGF